MTTPRTASNSDARKRLAEQNGDWSLYLPTRSTTLIIKHPDGSDLFVLHADGTVSGDEPTEAARVFVETVRKVWANDLAARIEQARAEGAAEALREAADPSLLDLATHGCGWRVLDHDGTVVRGYCGSTASEALGDWLRDRAALRGPR